MHGNLFNQFLKILLYIQFWSMNGQGIGLSHVSHQGASEPWQPGLPACTHRGLKGFSALYISLKCSQKASLYSSITTARQMITSREIPK